jgi:hypothetical protein
VVFILIPLGVISAQPIPVSSVSLKETLSRGVVRSTASGDVEIEGCAVNAVRVRVTNSDGVSSSKRVDSLGGRFRCLYPKDFEGAPVLKPSVLYVDATDAEEFDGEQARSHQAEVLLVVSGGPMAVPDLPLGFLEDFVDSSGGKDGNSRQWQRHRLLVNQFLRGRSAGLMGIRKPTFDLAQEADFDWFKQNATLYDFEHRDRDWAQPLGSRVKRGFWQAMWNRWFNSSNDHPWDGNAENRAASNYRPYTFTNDLADLLILLQMVRSGVPEQKEEKRALANEVLENLLALQHRNPENFALREPSGRQEQYTAGAFRYGLFETGEWLQEGRGWFANPSFRDFERGGVFNGRSLWALGECWMRDPDGLQGDALRQAFGLGLRFCLRDGQRYLKVTASGRTIWNPTTAGEHAYMLLGMLAAYRAESEWRVPFGEEWVPLRKLVLDGLDALVESADADGHWSRYSNATAINLAAVAEGIRVFRGDPRTARWREVAVREADFWLELKPLNVAWPTPMFGHMRNLTDGSGMTFVLGKEEKPHVSLYMGGHWVHALSLLYAATGDVRYLKRAEAVLGYYFGANPLSVRLLNELGAVYNRVSDLDADGTEDAIHWNAYPESTAFLQIGLLHFLEALQTRMGQ